MGGRVLLVEDDTALSESLRQLLEQEGYSVDAATDGTQALTRIAERCPDVILLDVMMPKMNGRQLLDRLRADYSTRQIPVVLMSAVNGIETNRTLSSGVVEVMAKPFTLDEVLNKVALALFRAEEPLAQDSGEPMGVFSDRPEPE